TGQHYNLILTNVGMSSAAKARFICCCYFYAGWNLREL
ncbi:unnamed protein product, partial [marine sediment metagenome]